MPYIGVDTAPQSFCHSYIAALFRDTLFEVSTEIRCSLFRFQVATVVMETTQLVLRQFKNVFILFNGELIYPL